MSTAATIPVLNLDTGDVHAIPTDQVDAARAAGGKPVATMRDPMGTMRYVPMDQIDEAHKNGGTLVPYGSPSSEQVAQDQTGIHPYTNPLAQGLAGIGRAAAGLVSAPYQALKTAFSDPTNTEETAAQGAGGPVGLAADRMLVQPAQAAHRTANDLRSQGHPWLAAGAELGALPIIGPLGQSLGLRAATGDVTGAVTEGIANALAPKAIETAAPIAAKLPVIKQVVQNRQIVPGENYTPIQHKAFSAVLARGTGMGKDFIAPDVASDIASPVRQAAADNPSLAQAVQNGTPKDALGASQAILQKAKETIDRQHQQALQPVANTPVNMQPVIDAVPDAKPFHDASEVGALQDLKNRASQVKTLGDFNDFRQYLGNERNFRQTTVAAARGSVADKALDAADSATRNHYYDQLEQATGLDFQGLKRTESGIIKAQEALQNTSPSLVNKDVLAHEDNGVLGTAANVIDTATRAGHGLPFVGYAAEKLRGTPLNQVQSGMQRFLGDLPQPSTYRGPLTSQWSPAPRGLPANVPANVPFAQGGGGQTVNTMFSGQTRVGTSQVTPAPVRTPLLPAQAGPNGIGVPPGRNITVTGTTQPPHGTIPLPAQFGQPLLGSGEGNSEFVTPPATYQPLNQATAVTNPNAGRPLIRPILRPVEPAQRPLAVNPQGQVVPERPLLPAGRVKTGPKKRNETNTFPQVDTPLPGPIQRVLHAAGATIQPAAGNQGGYHEAVASVSPDAPNTIQVEDPARFAQNKAQTVAHEAFHVWRNNLPPHIRALAPQDDTDQYNYADPGTMVRLRAQGKRLWNLPEESGATAMQYYTSQGGENAPKKIRDAYKPWVADMDTPLSTIMPTAANVQAINTTPRPPAAMYETKTFAKDHSAPGAKPVLKPAEQLSFVKGAPVKLKDGTTGRVAHVIAGMKTVRVRTDDGRNLTVRHSAVQPADYVLVKQHLRRTPS